ncbi:MAG: 2-phospho-L-lactate transferase [Candidatus Asgardarchaeia archaeon]|nr:MAG: 2-phospho-L-lactate transferase [Candidatus Asgardarchaeum californiense]
MIVVLAGGVGAARFLEGLVRVVPPKDIFVVVNTGDDEEFFGLRVCPDFDIITYTLAGLVDPEKGWGIKGDTFNCLDMLSRYGYETWFLLGDRDLATHIHRTHLLKKGYTIFEIAEDIRKRLGIECQIAPMTNEFVKTKVITKEAGELDFQVYFVKRRTQDTVIEVKFQNIEKAKPAPGILDAIESADGIIISPSNPIVSIGPILAIRGIRDALQSTEAKIVAISPIVGGKTIKGPADRMLQSLGYDVSPVGVAELYKDFLDVMIIDTIDAECKKKIEALGIKAIITNTIMKSIEDKVNLAKAAVEAFKLI